MDTVQPIENVKRISVELTFLPFFNLALQQNNIPIIYELKLKNNTECEIENIECVFSANPDLIVKKSFPIEKLAPHEEISIQKLEIELNYNILSSLSEAIKGKLILDIKEKNEIIFSEEHEIEAFAADQWLGFNVMPELVAAFVTPNLEVINQLLATVADELQKATASPSIQGYQADKTRVYEICSAIYRAIHSWGIIYSNPASSFGTPGQKIRFADSIYKYRLGTCLDTTLLFASVMEQCGLHPVIMIQSGHAYIGCHLTERYFSDVPMEDLQKIRKLVDLDEFIVIETTMVTGNATFSEAEAAARSSHLNIDNEFYCAIDVIRARYSKIRPLPLKRSTEGIELDIRERHIEELDYERKRKLQQDVDLSEFENTPSQSSRIAKWTQKLLDLSLRNRLLNVRDTRQIIPVACSNIPVLEDKIAADESISLNSLSNLLNEKDVHDLSMLRNSEVKSDIKALLDKELGQQRLWTMLPPAETLRRLTALYRQSRTDLEEGGVNTLFLALGFLEWKQTERDEKSYLAPILLVPVRMQRKSIASGIRISRIDEDTIINETLLELLRSQFQLTVPGLNPLPMDDSGVDVALVMQIFRQTIREMKGWEVREEAKIGHFSFGKFIMWNDMTARINELKENPLVNHLIEGGGLYDDGIEIFPPEKVAHHLDLKHLYCPLSADSSQLAAILYSSTGKSFVLHGPPGTGKSQTITNMIAHNLALGKRILFVSEKKAALEVVHRRLSAVGLRPFCLELHSNKSGKSEVLAQFAEALQVPDTVEPEKWQGVSDSLEKIRTELNDYVAELHKSYPNGLSAYNCFSKLVGNDEKISVNLQKIDFLTQEKDALERAGQIVSDLANAWSQTDEKSLEIFSVLDVAQWTPVYEKELIKNAEKLREACAKLLQLYEDHSAHFYFYAKADNSNIYNTALFLEMLKTLCNIPELLICDDFENHSIFISKFASCASEFDALCEKLKPYHLNFLKELDVDAIARRIQSNKHSFVLTRFFKNNSLLRELAGAKRSGGGKLTIEELEELLAPAHKLIELDKEYEKGKSKAENLLGKYWNDGSPDWEKVKNTIEQTVSVLKHAEKIIPSDASAKKQCFEKLKTILPDAEKIFAREGEMRNRINIFLEAWNDYQEKLQIFEQYSVRFADGCDLKKLIDKLKLMLEHSSSLRGVLRYRKIRLEAELEHLENFAEKLESDMLEPENAARFFELAIHTEMLDRILSVSPSLCNFSGLDHEERIRKFRELDAEHSLLAKNLVFAKLASNLPRRRSGPCPEGTELGILKRECEKRARHKPVRLLLEQIPSLTAVLKPCFLMSPLSVAQYLPPDSAQFDMIIFDEASQIPVWDAIGVIARGKQLIVVGDPKQMPPTNFFQKGESDNNDSISDEIEDMESILDECLAAGVHSSYLNWHYRSRHESLISFSNHHYYDDRLFTFPASGTNERLGVRFEFVKDAVYDRKLTRTNRKEAEAIVDYVFDRLEKSQGHKRSIGIVTFSQAQKDLIEDLMEQERSKHPALEEYFSDQNEEPLFIKNLENVQGDERDVILFSICYAPDAEGRFSMNFGPLNRQGGERRLNVAITRAKEQIVVFSSIRSTQIELSRTKAVGAAHLKYFLDYAENGLNIHSQVSPDEKLGNLAKELEAFLNGKGFAVKRNVGCSGYRIDLALPHPVQPDKFMLGIECDGPSYASQKTARDRDQLRASVLHSLGWQTYRIWSVDWAFDRPRSEQRLLELIEKLASTPPLEIVSSPSVPVKSESVKPPDEHDNVQNDESAHDNIVSDRPKESGNRREYVLWEMSCEYPQEYFYDPEARELIKSQLRSVIHTEAPIYERLLKKRIIKAWGFTRAGDYINNILNECMPQDLEITFSDTERIFWDASETASAYRLYRVASDERCKRPIDEIPPEELANAMHEILMDFNSCEQDTLYRETLKLFSLSTLTNKARKYLDYGMNILKQCSRI